MSDLSPRTWARSVAIAVPCALILSGCGLFSKTTGPAGADAQLAASVQPPSVNILPADKSQGVAPDTVVTVTASGGSIASVALHVVGTTTDLPGTVSNNHQTWKSSQGLVPGANYSVEASATAANGDVTNASSTFSTLTGNRLTTETTPGDGQTVGVGEPIILRFNTPVPAALQSALVSRIQVSATPAVQGAWHWFSPTEVHFRPAVYWPAHATVNVVANFQGVNAGNDTWGFANWSESFTIGDKHVSVIDDNTHQMVVYNNDQPIYTWGVSMGKPGFNTIGGTLVVRYKQQTVLMNSCTTFGGAACSPSSPNYYDEDVYWDTAISTDGFFIHAAPWSVYAQGHSDVSHGCVNLSTAEATTFFNWSQVGDVVTIANTGRTADAGDGEGDWQIPFAQYANSGGAPLTQATAQPGGI